MAGILFDDLFHVKDIDPDGKKFDRGKACTNSLVELVEHILFSFETFL